MYSLDVNFLKDRKVEEDAKKTTLIEAPGFSLGKNLPMLIGAGVMILLPAATGSLLWVINAQTASTQQRIQELESQIAQLTAQNQRIQEVEKQVSSVNEETQALVSVFNQIKPWSAVLQDIRDRTPAGVQIESIKQEAAAAPQGGSATPGIQLTLTGIARSYDDANDLVLSLQQSNFLKAQKTVLTNAELVDAPVQDIKEEDRQEISRIIQQGKVPGLPKNTSVTGVKDLYVFPKVIKYQIKTELGDIPASKLMPELARKGAVGLVTRIRTLEQKGAIQP
jgi:type IV pilus assembly protein PilN